MFGRSGRLFGRQIWPQECTNHGDRFEFPLVGDVIGRIVCDTDLRRQVRFYID